MGANSTALQPLSHEQNRLVEENLGLVSVHLRRHVHNLGQPRRDREWEDLFQEGCMGLIAAALRYRTERGIAFAAFALPRIHSAVTRALEAKFSTVRIPPKRGAREDTSANNAYALACTDTKTSQKPKVYSLAEEAASRLVDDRAAGRAIPSGETIGRRLRDKYERAVAAAGKAIAAKISTRSDRDKLVGMLIEERFLVPDVETRRPLRRIARDTSSSYARVAQCEKQITAAVARILSSDPEFGELRRRMSTHPMGADLPIDDEIECSLVSAGADELVRRFQSADGPDQAHVLKVVLEGSHADIAGIIRGRFCHLPKTTRDKLLRETADFVGRAA
ncbi:MAG: hypothetical protein JSU63_06695 [Phycisphaerales bacterium]|nr:MAG: hypothetical protein JSU63_06695 [Phycisphaerales bacterium]